MMAGINLRRLVAGGSAAGLLIWALEAAASLLYLDGMTAALEAHDLTVSMSATKIFLTIALSLLSGMTLVFLYAAMRPRFGRGPRTAVIAGVVMWVGAYLFSLAGYAMIGLYPPSMLVTWGFIGLAEMVTAAVVGAWVYRETGDAA
jgi:hypothetical protein